jgi:hypothetical protein
MDLEIQEFCMGKLAVIHIGQLGPQGASGKLAQSISIGT